MQFEAPESLDKAVKLLRRRGTARIVAGGTDLLVQLRARRKETDLVVDIKHVPELNALRYDPLLRLADEKHRKSIERAVQALPNLPIVAKFCRYYEITSPMAESRRLGEDLSPPSTESEVLPETETETETERGVRASPPNGSQPHSRSGLREVRL